MNNEEIQARSKASLHQLFVQERNQDIFAEIPLTYTGRNSKICSNNYPLRKFYKANTTIFNRYMSKLTESRK